jgi:hypothetical protein
MSECLARRLFPVLIPALSLSWSAATFAAGTAPLAPNADILTAATSFASTPTPPSGVFGGDKAVDNLITSNDTPADTGLIFFGSDNFDAGAGLNSQRVALTGFNSQIGEIWLYTLISDSQRVPASVTIWSSTTSTVSLSTLSYSLLLNNHPLGLAAFSNVPTVIDPGAANVAYPFARYAKISVNAPVGTQSLMFDFLEGATGGNGARIQEIQAFSTIPEPSSLLTLGLAAGLTLVRRRGRNASI